MFFSFETFGQCGSGEDITIDYPEGKCSTTIPMLIYHSASPDYFILYEKVGGMYWQHRDTIINDAPPVWHYAELSGTTLLGISYVIGTCESTMKEFSLTPAPQMPTVTGTIQLCAGQGTTLTASGGSGSYRWYEGSTLITGQTGVQFSTGALTSSKTYYVSKVNGEGCEGQKRQVVVTVNNPSSTVSAVYRCGPGDVELSATAGFFEYEWYDQDNVLFGTSTSRQFVTSSSGLSTYKVKVQDSQGCWSATMSSPATVTTTHLDPPVVSQASHRCGPGTAITLNGNYYGERAGDYYVEWYSSSEGGIPEHSVLVDENSNHSSYAPVLNSNKDYWVSVYDPEDSYECRTERVHFQALTGPPVTVWGQGYSCEYNTAHIQAQSASNINTYYLYRLEESSYNVVDHNSTGSFAIETFYTDDVLYSSDYYVKGLAVNGCWTKDYDLVDIAVIRPDAPSVTGDTEVCAGEFTEFTASGVFPWIYRWYEGTSDNLLAGESSGLLQTDALLESISFFVSYMVEENGGACESPKKEVLVMVQPLPSNPSLSAMEYCDFELLTLTGSAAENVVDYEWYSENEDFLGRGFIFPVGVEPQGSYSYKYRTVSQHACMADSYGNMSVSVTSNCDDHLNWIETESFNYLPASPSTQLPVAHSKSYFDGKGKLLQSQTKNLTEGEVLIASSIEDEFGRDVISTLPAPAHRSDFRYKHWFVTDEGGNLYDHTKFGEPVGTAPGTLGWYYSSDNTMENFVPVSGFPYSRVEFYDDGSGEVRRTAGPGETHRLHSGHELMSGTFPVFNELDDYLAKRLVAIPDISHQVEFGRMGVQRVSRDQNGRFVISVSDKSGRTVMTGRSPGPNESRANALQVSNTVTADDDRPMVYFYLLEDQEVELDAEGPYLIEDLVSGQPFSIPQGDWPAGFYRVIASEGSEVDITYGNFITDVSYSFYDDAGRLRVALSPNGFVQMLDPQNQGAMYQKDLEDNPIVDAPMVDLTCYQYNHQGWLLSSVEPDAGKTEYVYRRDGKIRFSQNAQQRISGHFSYTHYDRVGRPIESGEYSGLKMPFVPLTSSSFPQSHMNTLLEKSYQEIMEEEASLPAPDRIWVVEDLRDWVRTYYDVPATDIPHLTSEFVPEFVRGAVSWTENLHNKTWYSYDEFGRVSWMAQKPGALDRTFVTRYTYDFAGNVLDVMNASYVSQAVASPFYHHYEYDADQRLSRVLTSTDGSQKKVRAIYEYYLHGPLKRIELGEDIQGIDFVYNIQGWLTQINHPDGGVLDPGGDGETGQHSGVRSGLPGMTQDSYESYIEGLFQQTSFHSDMRVPPGGTSPMLAIHNPLLRVFDRFPETSGLRGFSAGSAEHTKLIEQYKQQHGVK